MIYGVFDETGKYVGDIVPKDSVGYTNSRNKHYISYFKFPDGSEKRWDSEGNEIEHLKYSDGFEHWKTYNSEGKIIHYKDSNGEEFSYEYDSDGNFLGMIYKDKK